jgi:hypothetical protein
MQILSNLLLGWLVVTFALLAIEGYVLLGRIDRLSEWTQQLLGAANALLATLPGKSAARTEAPPDVQPKIWWQRLRASADARERHLVATATGALAAAVDDVLTTAGPAPDPEPAGAMAVKVALTPDPRLADGADTEVVDLVDPGGDVLLSTTVPAAQHPRPRPSPGPDTRPAAAAIDQWHREATAVMPAPDPVDVALTRFDFAEGYQRPVSVSYGKGGRAKVTDPEADDRP